MRSGNSALTRVLLSAGLLVAPALADNATPGWLRFEPELQLAEEGFRGVRWCTRNSDIPWEMQGTFVQTLMRRVDEDYDVFGVRAEHISYTYRNAILYGVRIDILGREQVSRAHQRVRAEYVPIDGVVQVNERETRWRTAGTSVWVSLPTEPNGRGQIFLWGRDRKTLPRPCISTSPSS